MVKKMFNRFLLSKARETRDEHVFVLPSVNVGWLLRLQDFFRLGSVDEDREERGSPSWSIHPSGTSVTDSSSDWRSAAAPGPHRQPLDQIGNMIHEAVHCHLSLTLLHLLFSVDFTELLRLCGDALLLDYSVGSGWTNCQADGKQRKKTIDAISISSGILFS
jgi:hypothetical protein